MHPKVLYVLTFILAIHVLAAAHAETDLDLGIYRALYGPWNHTYEARVGLDTDYDHAWWDPRGGERCLEKFSRNSLNAAANNITHIGGLYYLGDDVEFNYSRAVHMSGEEQLHTPSPVDRTYWIKIIDEPAVAVANLSLYYPIRGLVWDLELYLADDPWEVKHYSFDEAAIQSFAIETGREIPPLDPRDRHGWLKGRGLLEEFQEWQEKTVYDMARSTEEKVHAINPNLLLGILNIKDAWLTWTILEGFSTPTIPLMAWSEDTYRGYSEEKIDELRQNLEIRKINGKVIPGLYTRVLVPWRVLDGMERATRHNGAFWVYQYNGDPYHQADEKTYSKAYEVLDEYIYFKKPKAEVLPSFGIFPGAEARPYGGPDGIISVFLKSLVGFTFPDEVGLVTDSTDLVYIGENLTPKSILGPNLTYSDLPCIVSGLNADDLVPTEAASLIRELGILLGAYNRLNLTKLEAMERALDLAASEYDAGHYDTVRSQLSSVRRDAYDQICEIVWPLIEEARKSPRTSSVPISVLGKMTTAQREYEDGDLLGADAYLMAGLREWSQAVGEAIWLWTIVTCGLFHALQWSCRRAPFHTRHRMNR